MKSTPCSLLMCLLAAACGSSSSQGRGPDTSPGGQSGTKSSAGRSGFPAPPWFQSPPKSNTHLYFVGDATQASDEGSARDAAKNKALAELTTYCGAQIKSEGQSVEREANGKYEQVVSLTVDVAGDELTVREAVIKQTVVGKGSEGTF